MSEDHRKSLFVCTPNKIDMPLGELPRGTRANVVSVTPLFPGDGIAERLRDLGFVPGESLHVVAHAPCGRDPLLVEIGATRFALRRAEANRITVAIGASA